MSDIMIDLETWGTTPGAALRSIGAVVFDPYTGVMAADFYANIDDSSCEAFGLNKDPRTVVWWAEQSAESRAALGEGAQPLPAVLLNFANWWADQGGSAFWAYGPNFDETLLAAAYRACSIATPWSYRQPRCARTILALAEIEVPRERGVHHNALDDARNQVAAVHSAFLKLGLHEPA